MCNLSDIPVPAVSTDGSDVLPGVLLDQPSPHCCLTPLQFQALFSKIFSLVQRQTQVLEEQITILFEDVLKILSVHPNSAWIPRVFLWTLSLRVYHWQRSAVGTKLTNCGPHF